MQFGVFVNASWINVFRFEQSESSDGIPASQDVRRSEDLPMWVRLQRPAPFCESGFTAINLLSASHQSDNHSPVVMSIHNLKHGFRFRPSTTSLFVFSLIPSALCFVENHDVSGWA